MNLKDKEKDKDKSRKIILKSKSEGKKMESDSNNSDKASRVTIFFPSDFDLKINLKNYFSLCLSNSLGNHPYFLP